MIYDLTEHFSDEFVVTIFSFKSYLINHDFHFLNEVPFEAKIDNEADYAVGREYPVIDFIMSTVS